MTAATTERLVLQFAGGDVAPSVPTVDSLSDSTVAWLTLSSDSQCNCVEQLERGDVDTALRSLDTAKRQIEMAYSALREAVALNKREGETANG